MKTIFIALALGLLLTACKGGGGGGGSAPNDPKIEDGGQIDDTPSTLQAHKGIWYACYDLDLDSDNVDDMSVQKLFTVGDNSLSTETTYFFVPGCSSGDEEYQITETSTYTRNENSYSLVLREKTYISLTDGDVTYNNNNSYCGLTNWAKDVPQSILGLDCGGTTSDYGDTGSLALNREDDTLTAGDDFYILAVGTDLTPNGQTIPNGSFSYSDGESVAIYAIFNNGSYSVYWYDLVSKVYNYEVGSYTSSNNVVNFTVITSTPLGCISGSKSRRFSSGAMALTMEIEESDNVIYGLKVSYTESQFRDAFLGGGFTTGCF